MDSPPVVEPPVIFDTLDDQNEEVTGVVAEESVDEDDASVMYNPFDRPPNELVTQVSPLSPQQRASNKRRRLGWGLCTRITDVGVFMVLNLLRL